ncbi:MAG: chemotaxis protein CheD [Alteromonadaceae bacterium]|nr:MAG: chemotaxis protein CheD [Alteromonadaceae bacterium]
MPKPTNTTHSGDEYHLNPGEFYFSTAQDRIHTLLGSCVAITLWHPRLRVGGMCHFLLPRCPSMAHGARDIAISGGRYSDSAMALFEREAQKLGTPLSDYQAKIFGGSNMLAINTLTHDDSIGTKNTEAALKHLAEHNIPLLVAHVGETGHRRIVFDVANGDVWVKHEPLQSTIENGKGDK